MEVKPFLHKHYMLFDYYELLEDRCDRCNKQIEGDAFTCESCNFWLHYKCARQQLPSEISDPLNSERTLQFVWYYYNHFMCSKCFRLSKGCGYYSTSHGSFKLDVVCASSTNWEVEEMDQKYKDVAGKVSWYRFNNGQPLTLVKYRKVRRYEYSCSWCDQPLSNTLMCCISLEEDEEICLHEACLTKIPHKINLHPLHPYHSLYLQLKDYGCCIACGLTDNDCSSLYCCGKCNIQIHILCSNLKSTLKHSTSHPHPLTYFRKARFECNICKLEQPSYDDANAFYRCVECDFNVHLQCLIPSSVKNKHHRHPLALIDFFIEDGSTEHYCDICEQRRHLPNHVYFCKECKFTAHIECALNMANGTGFDHGSTSMLMHHGIQQNYAELGTNFQMESFFHPHPLSLKRLIDIPNYKKLGYCMACDREICEDEEQQVYVCEESSCRDKDCYHKACAEMPFEFNLIHIHHHPLTLVSKSYSELFICDKCRDVSSGFKYVCFECSFELDIKCATADLIASETHNQITDQQQTKLSHFSHPHELLFGYVRPNMYAGFHKRCIVCWLLISGLTYVCFPCEYYAHQSCLLKLPSCIELPFHPKHTLYPYTQTLLGIKTCLACKDDIFNIGYSCSQCSVYVHHICTTSSRHGLTSKFHFHNLYYFYRSPHSIRWCYKCIEPCESFYRCIECDINFHLRCIQVPDEVRCKYHIHNLILKDHFVEDGSGEYYCDICEKERHQTHQVYSCQECDGLFVAHIECALAEVEDQLLE